MNKQLSIVIVSWNTKQLLQDCLMSLGIDDYLRNISYEIILVDNNSKDESAAMVASKFPHVKLITNQQNRGFGRANNQAFKVASGQNVLLLNPDTQVKTGAISKLLEFFESHPKAGIVAPQLINPDGSVQRSCREFPTLSNMFYELSGLSRLFSGQIRFRKYKMLDFDHLTTREVDQPEGAALLIPKKVLDAVGVFDERFFMLFEEVDLCYRIKQAGYQIWFYPEAKILHHFGQSIRQVKARMIYNSHLSMYLYWSKYHSGLLWLPFRILFAILMIVTGLVRIIIYFIKNNVFDYNKSL